MILKVHIQTLDHETEIELKKDQALYRLLILKSKSDYDKDPGTVWHGASSNEEPVKAINSLIMACHHVPHKPARITILDGMLVKIYSRYGETELSLSINQFAEGSNEVILLQTLFDFCKHIVQDEAFDRYVTSTEDYFN